MIEAKTEVELATAVKSANGPLRIRGGGTRDYGRPVRGEVISTLKLSGITLYEPGALTIVAQTGTPLVDIENELARNSQRLAFEPMDHRALLGQDGNPTIGGVIAANVSGPRRISVGAARDFLLGVRFVDGNGEIIKNGGRVMKNVTGYDLVKLMAGSYGTLGILTEVSLKVMPAHETAATIVLNGLDVERAVAAMSSALGSPYDVTGAAHITASRHTALRIEGFEKSVAYRTDKLTQHLGAFGKAEVISGEAHDLLWQDVRDAKALTNADGDIWRVSVKPSDGPAVVQAVNPTSYIMDWGGGLIWMETQSGTDIRSLIHGIAGHSTLIKSSAATRSEIASFQPEPKPLALISNKLRSKFDPRGILNPGLMS